MRMFVSAVAALLAVAILREPAEAERLPEPTEGRPVSDAEGSAVTLSARGVGQLSSSASASEIAEMEKRAAWDDGRSGSALLDLTAGLAELGGGSCQGEFGVLGEKMTVVSLDPPGGCVPGQPSQDVLAHFVGGSEANCRPPSEDSGCYRYVVARYADRCDLDPLEKTLGTRVSLTQDSSTPLTHPLFDKDGLYTKCSRSPLFASRTMRYIGSASTLGTACGQDYCETALDNAALRVSALWLPVLLAVVCTTQ